LAHLFKAINRDFAAHFLTWNNFQFTGPGIVNQPAFDYDTHEFLWNSTGSSVGTYTASVVVTDMATLTIHLVPEPATNVLLGLAAIALLGSRKCKNTRDNCRTFSASNLETSRGRQMSFFPAWRQNQCVPSKRHFLHLHF
jgi:hypothetical protein